MTTFNEIYKTVKSLTTDPDTTEAKPANPEIRYCGNGEWLFESGLYSAEDVEALCDLETFTEYFWEGFGDNSYEPSATDEKEFLRMVSEE